jgi:hypothetical protein
MTNFSKLKPYEQKDVITGLVLEGLTYEQIHDRYGISPQELADVIEAKAVKPFNDLYVPKAEIDKEIHKKTVKYWIKVPLLVSGLAFLSIVLIQMVLGGFDEQITLDSVAYITNPLSKVLQTGICIAAIVIFLHTFFPILTTFVNERVNTVSLQDTFLKARPEAKLNFLAIIMLSLAILFGLIFSAKAETNTTVRECILKNAYNEIGVVEKGGNNRGKRIDDYRSVSLGKAVRNYYDAWCGYFAHFCYKVCKNPLNVPFPPRARDWFIDRKKYVYQKNFKGSILTKKPQAGDVIGYKFTGGNIGHIEILVEWHEDEGYFLAIGGNTSNKNSVYRDADANDGVRLKKRPISMAYVVANHIDKL